MMTGWLDDITDWFREQFLELFNALVQLLKDAILWLIVALLDAVATVVELIPVPEFLVGVSIASMLGNAGPVVAWLVTTFKIGEGLALIGSAYTFRTMRRILTMGIW